MRVWCVCLLVCVGCDPKSNSASFPSTPREPVVHAQLTVDTRIDLGRIRLGKEPYQVHHVIRNTGTGTLQLTGIRSSCGCAVAQVASTAIEAGQESTLALRLSRERRGDHRAGVVLTSNSERNRETQLHISWFVSSDLSASPAALLGHEIDAGTTKSIPIEITVDGSFEKARVTATIEESTIADGTQLRLEQVHEGQYTFVASAGPSIGVGESSGNLVFDLLGSDEPPCKIPYVLRFNPPLTVSPKQVTKGSPSRAVAMQCIVRSKSPAIDLQVFANRDRAIEIPAKLSERSEEVTIVEIEVAQEVVDNLQELEFVSGDMSALVQVLD